VELENLRKSRVRRYREL